MIYLYLKAAHIIAVLVWVSGTLVVALAVSPPFEDKALSTLYRWDRYVTTPALAAVWIFGLGLVFMGGWWPEPWLLIKLTFVFFMSGIHGMLSGRVRRIVTKIEISDRAPKLRNTGIIFLVMAACVVVMVVGKPF